MATTKTPTPTKKTAEKISVSLYELLAKEIIHGRGLEEMDRLVEAKGESALDELYLNPTLAGPEFTRCITRHPDSAFCIVLLSSQIL